MSIQSILIPVGSLVVLQLAVVAFCFFGFWVWYHLKTKRCLERMTTELFTFNRVDYCWDPIGSIDARAIEILIEVIVKDKLPRDQKVLSRKVFDEIKLKDRWGA